eukprot:TRINITY_DN1231_c0_g1_i10.p1 TRINITY_DN1231_c0_g1~~TRINITY_DN1231_c0_g1_i10.p1  ORF type:complete len:345 (-),score=80.88 TRINITY_DN1231_c0_g1_i10:469-1503(-)
MHRPNPYQNHPSMQQQQHQFQQQQQQQQQLQLQQQQQSYGSSMGSRSSATSFSLPAPHLSTLNSFVAPPPSTNTLSSSAQHLHPQSQQQTQMHGQQQYQNPAAMGNRGQSNPIATATRPSHSSQAQAPSSHARMRASDTMSTTDRSEIDPSRSEDSIAPQLIVPTLQNVVSTVNLGCKLDLKEIALHARNAEYNPKRFAAVIMRIREPKTTALIFASGKMVCTGAKSEEDSRLAAKKYARIVQKIGYDAKFTDFKIQNIVGSCDVNFPIRLEGLAHMHHSHCSYEPELFPGLIYRMQDPKIVLLIFVSGKIVLTGAKTRDDIIKGFHTIYSTLQQFDKSSSMPQ